MIEGAKTPQPGQAKILAQPQAESACRRPAAAGLRHPRITLLATRQEPASLEEPQGRTAGPALQAGGVGGLAPSEGQSDR